VQGGVFAIAANHGEVVVVHGRAALKEKGSEAANLVHVDFGRSGDGMDAEAGILLLKLGQSIVCGHRFFKSAGRTAELVVELANAIERDFSDEEIETLLFEGLGDLGDGALGERTVGWNVDLADLVVLDELAADLAKLGAQKGSPPERFRFSMRPNERERAKSSSVVRSSRRLRLRQ